MSDASEYQISMAGGDGDELDAIQRRADMATEGPWTWGEETDEWGDCGPNLETVARGPFYSDGSQGAEETVIGSWGHDANGISVEDHDAEFIAHARTDVPTLLALVRELKARLAVVAELAIWSAKHGWKLDAAALRAALKPTP